MSENPNFGKWLHNHQSFVARQAPPPPRASELLERIRPWWERWPERFKALATPLSAMEVHYGLAASSEEGIREGYPVPTVIVRTRAEARALARIVYFVVADGRLRLRFQMSHPESVLPAEAEVTFVEAVSGRPLFAVPLAPAVGGRYRIEAELSSELAQAWTAIKVTDRMPFHLIIQQTDA